MKECLKKKQDDSKKADDILDKSQTSVFGTSIESPIDWSKSNILIDKNRGFETIEATSTFYKRKSNQQSMSDSSYSRSTSRTISSWSYNDGVSTAVSRRVTESNEDSSSKGILVIQAFVTSKNTRYFDKLELDPVKLTHLKN